MEIRRRSLPDFASRLLALVRAYPVASAAALGGVAVRVAFWVATDRRFEDALITVAHARNAVDGIGLTHHPGEGPTHGFTSAIGVLVPLAGEVVHGGAGFFALRLASVAAFAVAIVCVTGIGRCLGISQWLMIFPLAYLAFDQNQVFYGMAGMETQIATAVLLAGIYSLTTRRIVVTGVLLGLALLVRPDFVLLVAPALVFLFFRRRRDALVAGSVAAASVLPWVAFTSVYYGSPVPNTLHAKAMRYPTEFPTLTQPYDWADYTWSKVSYLETLWTAWTPYFENGFVVRAPADAFLLAYVAMAFSGLAAVGAWSARRNAAWRVAIAYGVLFLIYRINFLPPVRYYEWYVGPFMALAAVAAASGLASIGRRVPRAAVAVSCALALAFSVHMPFTFVLEQRVQRQIEDRVRKPMAEYLDRVARPGDRVVSESAGYVGFYSRVTLYDYPGLTSLGALRALQKLGPGRNSPLSVGLSELANAVHSEWLILRPYEWDSLVGTFPKTAALYRLDRTFTVPERASKLVYGGVEYENPDRAFLVLRRVGRS